MLSEAVDDTVGQPKAAAAPPAVVGVRCFLCRSYVESGDIVTAFVPGTRSYCLSCDLERGIYTATGEPLVLAEYQNDYKCATAGCPYTGSMRWDNAQEICIPCLWRYDIEFPLTFHVQIDGQVRQFRHTCVRGSMSLSTVLESHHLKDNSRNSFPTSLSISTLLKKRKLCLLRTRTPLHDLTHPISSLHTIFPNTSISMEFI